MAIILITGATAGIGRHAALEFVRRGHHVIATGRREAALEALKEEAQRLGSGKLDTLRLDVTREEDVQEAKARADVLSGGHGVDVLVNNAGYGQMGPIETVSDRDFRQQYETNVFGLMSMTRAFVPQMRARGAGRIINVSSIGGRATFPLGGVYSSTKYAVESLSDALRLELAPFGIEVSIVEPGPIRTEFNDRAMDTIDLVAVAASPYAKVIERAETFRKAFEARAAGPEVTTRAIAHAALAKSPRVRYVVPRRATLLLATFAVLPTRLVDWVMRRLTGLSALGAARPSLEKSSLGTRPA